MMFRTEFSHTLNLLQPQTLQILIRPIIILRQARAVLPEAAFRLMRIPLLYTDGHSAACTRQQYPVSALSSFLIQIVSFLNSIGVIRHDGFIFKSIYYDNGQVELSRILASVFNVLLPNVVTKKVIPSDYRLFQVADFICTMKLTELKIENHNMSVQEKRFFGGEDGIKKNYLKDLKKYELT